MFPLIAGLPSSHTPGIITHGYSSGPVCQGQCSARIGCSRLVWGISWVSTCVPHHPSASRGVTEDASFLEGQFSGEYKPRQLLTIPTSLSHSPYLPPEAQAAAQWWRQPGPTQLGRQSHCHRSRSPSSSPGGSEWRREEALAKSGPRHLPAVSQDTQREPLLRVAPGTSPLSQVSLRTCSTVILAEGPKCPLEMG